MLQLPLLLLALTASATDTPAVIKPVRVMNGGVTDEAFTLIATPTESSINLWSLATGRQTGHVDLPTFERKHEKDAISIVVHSIRTDLGLVMATVKHWFYNPAYNSNSYTSEYWAKSEYATYLAPLDESQPPVKLWSGEGSCASYGIQTYCAGPVYNDGRTMILADRPEATIHGVLSASGNQDSFRKSSIVLAYDLKGRKLYESRDTDKPYPKPDASKTSDGIKTDAQSCRVLRNGKATAFLEECKQSDYPGLSPDRKTATSNYDGQGGYKVWDAETGQRLISFTAKNPERWSFRGVWTELPGGLIAGGFIAPDGGDVLQIWNPRTEKLVAAGSGPEFKQTHNFRVGGGRLLVDRIEKGEKADTQVTKTLVIELDAAPAPASPAIVARKVDVDTLPSGESKLNPDAFAVVIGVEKYRQAGVPAVDYASRDAKTMAAYLGAMGFDAKNVAVLTDAQAGKVDFDKHFGKWLKNRVGPKSRVFVYYAGHGAPNPTTGAGYLMPYEADPSYLDETAYPVSQLYAELAKLPTKDVTVVLDACFSGQGERSLIAKGTRPLVALQKTRGPENVAVIAAASGSQISASDHEARHGLLTYHLLAGLHGGADENADGQITTAELFAYARPAVERAAKLQNVAQTPTVSGDDGPAGARVWTTLKKP